MYRLPTVLLQSVPWLTRLPNRKYFGRPGHVNPLYAQEKGVLRRAGHTEACVDMARLAGLYPAAALMEVMNEDGTMARLPELKKMADEYGFKLISIADLIAYRLKTGITGRKKEWK